MKSIILPICGILLLLLCVAASYGYNTKKCDDKPSETGPCKALFPMWRFIKATRECEYFIYGGCKATKNIFDDEEQCKAQCLK